MNWEGLRQQIERQDDYFIDVAEAENPSQPDGLLRKRFWAAYSTADSHRAWSQLASALLYLLGTSLISIVAAQNLRFFLEYLFDRS